MIANKNTAPIGVIGGVDFDKLILKDDARKGVRNFNKLIASGDTANVLYAYNQGYAGQFNEGGNFRKVLEAQVPMSGAVLSQYQTDVIGRFSGTSLPPPGVGTAASMGHAAYVTACKAFAAKYALES